MVKHVKYSELASQFPWGMWRQHTTCSFSPNSSPELKCPIKKEPRAAFLPKDPSVAEGTQFSFLEDFVLLYQRAEWSRYCVKMRLLIVLVWTWGTKP